MMYYVVLCFLPVLFVFGGCATQLQVASKDTKPILLHEPQLRSFQPPLMGTIQFPAGIYQPDFQTADGIYYRASSSMIVGAAGFTRVTKGGLFVPFAPLNEREACWLDETAQGSVLAFSMSQPTRRYPLKQPVAFDTVGWNDLIPSAQRR
jgi:hypothetical protein